MKDKRNGGGMPHVSDYVEMPRVSDYVEFPHVSDYVEMH